MPYFEDNQALVWLWEYGVKSNLHNICETIESELGKDLKIMLRFTGSRALLMTRKIQQIIGEMNNESDTDSKVLVTTLEDMMMYEEFHLQKLQKMLIPLYITVCIVIALQSDAEQLFAIPIVPYFNEEVWGKIKKKFKYKGNEFKELFSRGYERINKVKLQCCGNEDRKKKIIPTICEMLKKKLFVLEPLLQSFIPDIALTKLSDEDTNTYIRYQQSPSLNIILCVVKKGICPQRVQDAAELIIRNIQKLKRKKHTEKQDVAASAGKSNIAEISDVSYSPIIIENVNPYNSEPVFINMHKSKPDHTRLHSTVKKNTGSASRGDTIKECLKQNVSNGSENMECQIVVANMESESDNEDLLNINNDSVASRDSFSLLQENNPGFYFVNNIIVACDNSSVELKQWDHTADIVDVAVASLESQNESKIFPCSIDQVNLCLPTDPTVPAIAGSYDCIEVGGKYYELKNQRKCVLLERSSEHICPMIDVLEKHKQSSLKSSAVHCLSNALPEGEDQDQLITQYEHLMNEMFKTAQEMKSNLDFYKANKKLPSSNKGLAKVFDACSLDKFSHSVISSDVGRSNVSEIVGDHRIFGDGSANERRFPTHVPHRSGPMNSSELLQPAANRLEGIDNYFQINSCNRHNVSEVAFTDEIFEQSCDTQKMSKKDLYRNSYSAESNDETMMIDVSSDQIDKQRNFFLLESDSYDSVRCLPSTLHPDDLCITSDTNKETLSVEMQTIESSDDENSSLTNSSIATCYTAEIDCHTPKQQVMFSSSETEIAVPSDDQNSYFRNSSSNSYNTARLLRSCRNKTNIIEFSEGSDGHDIISTIDLCESADSSSSDIKIQGSHMQKDKPVNVVHYHKYVTTEAQTYTPSHAQHSALMESVAKSYCTVNLDCHAVQRWMNSSCLKSKEKVDKRSIREFDGLCSHPHPKEKFPSNTQPKHLQITLSGSSSETEIYYTPAQSPVNMED